MSRPLCSRDYRRELISYALSAVPRTGFSREAALTRCHCEPASQEREGQTLYVMLHEIPQASPRRPDTGALFPFRLIQEDRHKVIYADSAEDLARAICTPFGYPKPGMPRSLITFELMAGSRRMFSIDLANKAQAIVLASHEAATPLANRKLSSWVREALFQNRAETPRHPILLWPRRDMPLILVASSYAPVTARARTLGATYIDDLDDLALVESAAGLLGWRLDQVPEGGPGEGVGDVGGQGSEW